MTSNNNDNSAARRFSSQADAMAYTLTQRGKALSMAVLHDDHCKAPVRECCCSPDYIVEPMTTESMMAGAKAEREQVERVRRMN